MDSENVSPFSDEQVGGPARATDWMEYVHAVRERLWIVILCLVIGAIAAAVYLSGQKQRFQARAVLFVEQEQTRVLSSKVQEVQDDQILSLDMINTVVDLLHSYPFAQRVAARLNLQKDPRFLAEYPGRPGGEMSADEAAGALAGSVTASYRLKTRLIDVFVTQADSTMAVLLANAYVDEYVRYGFERRAEVNTAANQFLLDESERLRKQVKASEEAMQSFRERERSGSLEEMVQSSEGKLTELSKSKDDVENRIFQLDTDLKAASAAKPGDTASLLRLPSVAAQPKVVDLNQQIAEGERQFALLKQRYRAKHPAYIAAQTQIASLQSARNQVLQDVIGLLHSERQRLQAQDDEFKKATDDQQTRLLSVTGKSVDYNDLKRALETNTAMYNAILSRIAEVDVTKGLTDSPVRVHERATGASALEVSPVKVYSLDTFGGLGVGVVIALILHFLDRSVKTIDQAEEISGIPVLAAIPRKPKTGGRDVDVVTDREGMVAEGFRSLRTSLAMTTHVEDRRTFLFTSAQPSEGKTFCSANFAATLAQQGFRTLLIDADLRRSMVSRLFGGLPKPGLTEILSGHAALADAVTETHIPDLSILSGGTRTAHQAELLANQRMRDLISEALALFDRVVIDSAPLLAVSDSLLIAPHCDVTCMVLRAFKTPRKTFARALKSLADIHCYPAGIVFNFLPTGAGSYYYYSGKYYGNYEKGAYGS